MFHPIVSVFTDTVSANSTWHAGGHSQKRMEALPSPDIPTPLLSNQPIRVLVKVRYQNSRPSPLQEDGPPD